MCMQAGHVCVQGPVEAEVDDRSRLPQSLATLPAKAKPPEEPRAASQPVGECALGIPVSDSQR